MNTTTNTRRSRTAACLAVMLSLLIPAASERVSTAEASSGESLSGHLVLLWGDPSDGGESRLETLLVDAQGESHRLEIPAEVAARSGGLHGLDRRFVQVSLGSAPDGAFAASSPAARRVESIRYAPSASPGACPLEAHGQRGSSGSKRYISILCRFADLPSLTPEAPSYVEELVDGPEAPSLSHYWREASYGAIDLDGSDVAGWYTLPRPRAQYLRDLNGNGSPDFDFGRLVYDAASLANADVNFADFDGVNICLNGEVVPWAFGGSWPLQLDGVFKIFNVTWLPDWGWTNQSLMAHETGHSLGMWHSSGSYGETYDSRWDVMSDCWSNCEPADPSFHCVAGGPAALNKDLLGWIPDDRRYVAAPSSSATITVGALAAPAEGSSYLMGLIPIDVRANRYYTVEARRRVGYDDRLPGEGVIIHDVDLSQSEGRWQPAYVVDATNDGDPNDDGAIWTPGERFRDTAKGISVSVLSATANGYVVEITRAGGDDSPCSETDVAPDHWRGDYYSNTFGYGVPAMTRDDGDGNLKFSWSGSPGACVRSSFFAARWSRRMTFDGGPYRFLATADDAVRISLDGEPLVTQLHDGPLWILRDESYAADAQPSAGEHLVTVEYLNLTSGGTLEVAVEDISDFSLAFAPGPLVVRPGQTVRVIGAIERRDGFSGPVTVSASDAIPIGVMITSRMSVTKKGRIAKFTIRIEADAPVGVARHLQFTATDKAGRSRTATLTLLVL